MQIIEWGIQIVLDIISGIGYSGVVLLMALESACLPIPSEIVMPFSGMLAFEGRFDLLFVALAGTAGCVIGSVTAYWIGLKGGRELVCRYSHILHINEAQLNAAERWFEKYGAVAVFFTRLTPIVRTFISLPAGMARYKFWPFVTMTAIGSFIWCYILAYVGYAMGSSWRNIEGYYQWLDIAVIIGFTALVAWYLLRRRKRVKNKVC
jgi:membrane protein DedA with SNARE-associated domain